MRLIELHKQGDTEYTTKYDYLYHLTDHHGVSHSIDSNSLKTLRNTYISTTYDPDMNRFVGGDHYDFKFVFNAKPLVKKYGAFEYDFQMTYTDGTSDSANEREIGIDTKIIKPLNRYLKGVVLIFDLFSQKSVQWLLYANPESRGGIFSGATKTASPKAIETLFHVMEDWKKPVWSKKVGQDLTNKERSFLKDVRTLHNRGASFQKGLLRLSEKYHLTDHWDKPLESDTVLRRQKANSITNMFNKYYTSRTIEEIKPEHIEKLVIRAMKMLKYGDNIISSIIGQAREANLIHPAIPPVEWSIVFRHLIDGEIEDAHEAIDYLANRNKRQIEYYDNGDEFARSARHVGTSF